MYVLARNILSQSCYCGLFSLLVCIHLHIGQKYSVSKLLFSLFVVCIGLPNPAHPPKVKYSLSPCDEQAIKQNISLCMGVLVLEVQYIHVSRENKSFETEYFWPINTYIHTSRERERNRWISWPSVYCKTMAGLPYKIILGYDSVTIIFGYGSEFLKVVIGNQMNGWCLVSSVLWGS